MDWDIFLALLFFFKYNNKTESVVDALGFFPVKLKKAFSVSRNAHR